MHLSQLAEGDDFALSFIYSLLNYITATNQDMDVGSWPYLHNTDSSTAVSMESGLRGKTESEKQFIGISTISVVTRLALVFKREDVSIRMF